ncbi:CcdB family protein [Spiribacter sp. 218]|uniref:CcdB family protein n=1 Tax=Spiribacter pallidus TaxID=1987936 RepID=UPI00349F940B
MQAPREGEAMVLGTHECRIPQPKKRINISIDADLLAEAKHWELNLSGVFEDYLRQSMHELRCRQWVERNRRALIDHSREPFAYRPDPINGGQTYTENDAFLDEENLQSMVNRLPVLSESRQRRLGDIFPASMYPVFRTRIVRLDRRAPFLVGFQSALLEPLGTEIVAPLIPTRHYETPLDDVHPIVELDCSPGSRFVLVTHHLMTVTQRSLGEPVEYLAKANRKITRAIDFLLGGI